MTQASSSVKILTSNRFILSVYDNSLSGFGVHRDDGIRSIDALLVVNFSRVQTETAICKYHGDECLPRAAKYECCLEIIHGRRY